MKAKKLILAGDPKQLPPTVLSAPKRNKTAKDATIAAKNISKTKLTPSAPARNAEILVGPDTTEADSDNSDEEPEPTKYEETVDVDDETAAVNDEAIESHPVNTRMKGGVNQLVPLSPPRSLETTLFDRLLAMHGPRMKRMLNVQYRSIISFDAFGMVY